MQIDSPELPINVLIKKINDAAKGTDGVMLTNEETKLLSEEFGDLVFIPYLTNEEILKMQKDK